MSHPLQNIVARIVVSVVCPRTSSPDERGRVSSTPSNG